MSILGSTNMKTGVKTIFAIILLMIILRILGYLSPAIFAVTSWIAPIIIMVMGILAIIWLLGFLVNISKLGIDRIREKLEGS